tara:strand:+ start:149 stop:2593 length:2445 start_codon:yes stop_codon:yes gene_type:complete
MYKKGFYLFLILLITSCADKQKTTENNIEAFFTNIEDIQKEEASIWINQHTFFKDTNNNICSRINKKSIYGIGAQIPVTKKIKNKNIEVGIHAKVKKEELSASSSFNFQIELNDSIIFWSGSEVNTKTPNQWDKWSKRIKIPRNFTLSGMKFKMYFMNTDSSNVYIDDFKINFSELLTNSYIPFVDSNLHSEKPEKIDSVLYRNIFFSICLGENKNIILLDKEKSLIFNNIIYTTEIYINDSVSEHLSSSKFIIKKILPNTITLQTINENCKINLNILVNDSSRTINFYTETSFLKNTNLNREALVFNYSSEVSEIYKKNRQVDKEVFETEYWLDNQGVKIGESDNTCIIYQPKDISSLQINTQNKSLVVNLDYYKDHPLLHFPILDSAKNEFNDISSSVYRKHETRTNNFSFLIGIDNDFFPRVLKNPNGYISTYVFTEHADWTDIKTHRATYFGSSEIKKAEDATGGFMKYKIPVTKSVFYNNKENYMNDDKRNNSSFNSPIASIKNTNEMLEFLLELRNNNCDICLHTPDQYTTTKENLKEAAVFMKETFKSSTWIDHGYNNGIENNRENIVCDGLNKRSKYYSIDILKSQGVSYFWNCYYEDVYPFPDNEFYSFIGSPYHGFGNNFPTPDFWSHNTRASNIFFWKTTGVLEPKNKWNYFFNIQRIEDFVRNYSVEFNHCYPAWIDAKKGFWTYGDNEELVVNLGFNETLKLLNSYRKNGLINITTINKIMNYWIQQKGVEILNIQKNTYKVTNTLGKKIYGYSMAINSDSVYVNNEIPKHKYYINDLIFWFDLEANETKTITTLHPHNIR